MKASQITTRNRKNKPIAGSIAALAVLTFFAAGPADARCRNKVRQVQIESRFVTAQDNFTQEVGTDFRGLSHTPRTEARNRNNRNYNSGQGEFGRAPLDVRGIYLIAPVAPQGFDQNPSDDRNRAANLRGLPPVNGDTTYNIGDTEYDRRKAERAEQRRRIIEGLKEAGVIREPGQPATTTTTTTTDNNTGSTTTKPKPAPKPVVTPKRKPQPKVTKLPNGDQITEYPDGRRVVKLKDGSTVSTYPDGKRVTTNSNGDTTVTEPGGYRKTTNRYGDGTAHFPDGTRIDFKASGEATLTRPDGTKFHRMPGKGFTEVD